jgi:hypothetical protein
VGHSGIMGMCCSSACVDDCQKVMRSFTQDGPQRRLRVELGQIIHNRNGGAPTLEVFILYCERRGQMYLSGDSSQGSEHSVFQLKNHDILYIIPSGH